MLLDETITMIDGYDGCSRRRMRRSWRVVRRRTGSSAAATGATTPAAGAVVVAGWVVVVSTVVAAGCNSSDYGGVNGQDALTDRDVGESAAVHRDPAARRIIPRHHLRPYSHQRIFPVFLK